jgi:thioredoxin-related protein
MKRLIAVTIVVFLTLAAGAFAAVDWERNYDAGLEKAKKDKKLMMVDIYTDWCGWCKKLDRDTYSDADVGNKVTKDFVAVKLNPEKSPQGARLSRQFGTTGFPHIVFVDATGAKVSEINGYLAPKEFLKRLEMISDKVAKK